MEMCIYDFEKKEMIENVMYVEELLHNIQYELWEIGDLDPTNFVSRLQMYPVGGWEDQVLSLLRQAVHEYQNERAILKYLYIGDKLAKVPGFQNVVPPFLVDLYCDVFYFLHLQKCSKDLQQLKILRKFWVESIHPFFLSQMREKVMARTGVDIDVFSKPETIAKIKAHYANKLNMTEEDIKKHFPPPRKPSEERRQERASEDRFNHQYLVEGKNNYPYFASQGGTYQGSNRDGYSNNQVGNYPSAQSSAYQVNQPQAYSYSVIQPPVQPFQNGLYLPPTQLNDVYAVPPNDPRLQVQPKRKRFASQETRAVGISSEWQPKPKKSQHKEESILDWRMMLERIKEMSHFECKECGLRFSSGENLEKHKDEHVQEKLSLMQGGGQGREWRMSSEADWIGEDRGEFNCQNFVIGEQAWPQEEVWCSFCCCWLGRSWVNDEWVLSNASLVRVGDEQTIMHKSCQRTLQQSQKRRPQ